MSPAANNAAENTDEQRVGGNLQRGKHIRKNTGEHDHQTGIGGKPLPDKSKADRSKNGVENQIDY